MQLTWYKVDVIQLILLGFLIFGLKEFAVLIFQPLQHALALPGLLLIFISPFIYNKKSFSLLNGNISFIYSIFLIWTITIIIRPILLSQSYSVNSMHPYFPFGITSYLLPLVALINLKINSIDLIFKVVSIFAIVGIIYFLLNYNNMLIILGTGILMGLNGEMGINNLANNYAAWFGPSSFSLLLLEFLPKKQKWIVIFSNIFILVLLIFFARRSAVFMYLLYFSGMFYLYTLQSKGIKRMNKAFIIFLIIITSLYIFFSYSDSFFSLFFNRLEEDTRSGVDFAAIEYLNKENAWLIGNGIEAAYFHPDFDELRYVHETGYIYMIMKGGIVYLSLYVILLFHAFYSGFFRTNNRFSKGIALYVLFHIIFLIPFGLPNFSLGYLLVWIGFALCENQKFRNLTNQELIQYFKNI